MSRPSAIMDYQLITTWLGLPSGSWPPDHYTLLGLPPGETNMDVIEQRVHERLIRIRSYQLSHPEVATEAMKRLAQAFDCLTNQHAKKTYDAAHCPKLAAMLASVRTPTVVVHDTQANSPAPAVPPPVRSANGPPAHDAAAWWAQQEMVWKPGEAPPVRTASEADLTPPPVRMPKVGAIEPPPARLPPVSPEPPPLPAQPPPLAIPLEPAAAIAPEPTAQATQTLTPPPIRAPLARPVDPIFELARSSPALRQGLGTRRGLYERVLWLRQLLHAWDGLGKHVARPKKKLTRTADEDDLAHQLEAIEELLLEQPSLLGQPGQPGYRVLALAGHESVAAGFKALDDQQRDLLARDWIAGRTMLRAHSKFLRSQVKNLRRLSKFQRALRTINGTLTDHKIPVLLALGLVALLILVVIYFI